MLHKFDGLTHNGSFREIGKDIIFAYITRRLNFLDLYSLSQVEKYLLSIIKTDLTKHRVIVEYTDNTKLTLSGTYINILQKLQTTHKGARELKEKNKEYRQQITSLNCKLNGYEFCSDYVCVNFSSIRKPTKDCCIEVTSTIVGSAMCLTMFSTGVFGAMPLPVWCLKPTAVATASGIGTGCVSYALLQGWLLMSEACHSLFIQKSEQVSKQIDELNEKINGSHVPIGMQMMK